MGFEGPFTTNFIDDLIRSNPNSDDSRSVSDDHLRIIKVALLNTFSGISGAVTVTHTELNEAGSLDLDDLVKVGSILFFGGTSAPSGYLLCDGTTGLDSIGTPALAPLFAVIGTTYGGTGDTDFALPDLQGSVPYGMDAGSSDFTSLNDGGGSKTNTLVTGELPSHGHTGSTANASAAHTHTLDRVTPGGGDTGLDSPPTTTATSSTSASAGTSHSHTDTSSSSGSGAAHNNLQPYLTLNYIIKK